MGYVVAVIGGACAGSEMASKLAALDMDVVVFEQNPLPYGKIEDGLPRWHKKLQAKERKNIDGKLDQARVHFMPSCKIGETITVEALRNQWKFPLVIMANGAWRDRALRAKGAEDVTRGLVYQNPFVYWFNHYEERNYQGPNYRAEEGAVIVGGGLASIDMAKICQFQTFREKAAERGHEVDVERLEHYGVYKVAKELGFEYDDLGIKPARLFYRKEVADMPLVPLGDSPTPERQEKARAVREKIIRNAITKFGFEVNPLRSPAAVESKDGALTAMIFDCTQWQDGKLVKTGQQERVETSLVISSIGSIPEPISGVPMDGELYQWDDTYTGAVSNLSPFYCVGNAITGKGNIKDSTANSRRLAGVITASMNKDDIDYTKLFRNQEDDAAEHIPKIQEHLGRMPETDDAHRAEIMERVAQYHQKIAYTSYGSWRDQIMGAR